jgi:hypothetical protein
MASDPLTVQILIILNELQRMDEGAILDRGFGLEDSTEPEQERTV